MHQTEREEEPDIYHAIRPRRASENLVILPDGSIDFNDQSKTENTRVPTPFTILTCSKPRSKAGHAKK